MAGPTYLQPSAAAQCCVSEGTESHGLGCSAQRAAQRTDARQVALQSAPLVALYHVGYQRPVLSILRPELLPQRPPLFNPLPSLAIGCFTAGGSCAATAAAAHKVKLGAQPAVRRTRCARETTAAARPPCARRLRPGASLHARPPARCRAQGGVPAAGRPLALRLRPARRRHRRFGSIYLSCRVGRGPGRRQAGSAGARHPKGCRQSRNVDVPPVLSCTPHTLLQPPPHQAVLPHETHRDEAAAGAGADTGAAVAHGLVAAQERGAEGGWVGGWVRQPGAWARSWWLETAKPQLVRAGRWGSSLPGQGVETAPRSAW